MPLWIIILNDLAIKNEHAIRLSLIFISLQTSFVPTEYNLCESALVKSNM